MKKYPASKSAKVIAFLKANSTDITALEKPRARDKSLPTKGKPSIGNSRKAS
jgi:hypothetical protein